MSNRYFVRTIFIVFLILFSINVVTAAQINSDSSVQVGQTITITLDFGTYIAAHDQLEVIYNKEVLEYISGDPLKQSLWYDSSESYTGIRTRTYTFRALKDGISIIRIKVNGLVSAGYSMTPLGDIDISKSITIGKGYTTGDVNYDGKVNSEDAATILDKFKNNNISEEDIIVADINSDSKLNSEDASKLLDVFKKNQ